jgi:hypothetical protein
VVVCAWLLACGGAASEARPPAPPPAPPAPVAAPAPSVGAPPAALAGFWVAPPQPQTFSARVALAKLARGPLTQAILPTLRPSFPARYAPCIDALLQHSDELLVRGAEENESVFAVISFDAQGLTAVRDACLGSVVPNSDPISIPGASEAYGDRADAVAFVPPSTLLIGRKDEVRAALAPGRAAAPLPPHFTLKGDQLVGLRVDTVEPKVGVDASLTSSPDLFSLDARASLPAEELAAQIEQGFGLFRGQAKERAKEAGGDATIQALLDGITLERRGSELHANLTIRGNTEQQARAIGQMVAFAVVSTERYLASAKAAEAKAVMAVIVKAYQHSLREALATSPKKPRKLASLPPVPATVPRGEPYQSKPEDWKGWAALQFSIAEPQRYQYEVVAAKNGKTAQVIARGDLDGDGDLSVRTLTLELDPKTGQLTAKGFEETKPLE